ncbi:MAG: hydrogenase maturation nickel metallochaperone HypA [Oscillospiraceae bacterium]
MVKTIEGIVQKENLTKVEKIVLQVGELSGVIPAYIKDCYPAAVYKTFLENTELELEVIPGIARCEDCGEEFNALACDLTCPKCKSQNLTALGGREFLIKEILAC